MQQRAEFPEQIQTDRLTLLKYTTLLAPELFRLIDRNRDILVENFAALAKDIQTIQEAESLVAKKNVEWHARSGFCYGIFRNSSNTLIGQLQVKNLAWDVPSAELSYFIDRSCQRKGFAAEAINALLALAFERLAFNRVFLRVIAKNLPSVELAKKLGFHHEGLHRAAFRCGHGFLHDVHFFSRTRADGPQASPMPDSPRHA